MPKRFVLFGMVSVLFLTSALTLAQTPQQIMQYLPWNNPGWRELPPAGPPAPAPRRDLSGTWDAGFPGVFKVWEDQRGGSPYAPGWRVPPIPPGNKWVHNVTFHEPGSYVLRAQAHDGYQFANKDVTFTVTP